MADSFDLNNQSRAADAAPQIPTSSSEVAVRTMASDIDLMGKSGGMMGQSAPTGVQVPVNIRPEAPAYVPGTPLPVQPPAPGHTKAILITIAVIAGALGLFALGYFVIGK